jgi:menaquinone-dependent protoporphyrinogen oxidase
MAEMGGLMDTTAGAGAGSCDVPVLYATSEGQTRRIAEHIADMLRDSGLDSRCLEVGSREAAELDWTRVRAAVLGASLHIGRHQRRALAFARRHADALNACPTAFFSVSLSAGSRNPTEVEAAETLARAFVDTVRWHPRRIACFAGRLAYTQYGLLKRFVMRRIARREGAPTDTGRDYEFTDWAAVSRFARDFAADIRETARP